MVRKDLFLDIRQLKRVREDVENIGSDKLKQELDEVIVDGSGVYLYNVLSEECLVEFDGFNGLLMVSL